MKQLTLGSTIDDGTLINYLCSRHQVGTFISQQAHLLTKEEQLSSRLYRSLRFIVPNSQNEV